MVKLGNTSFDVEAVKAMTFDEFEANYKGLLQGHDLKGAWLILTGGDPVLLPLKKGKHGKVGKPEKEPGEV